MEINYALIGNYIGGTPANSLRIVCRGLAEILIFLLFI